jgi:ATP-dependent DNA helicase RecG
MAWPSYKEHPSQEGGGFGRHALFDLSARITLPELRAVPVTVLPGVGPRIAASLRDLNVTSFADLVSHYPSRHEDLSNVKKISNLRVGERATVVGRVVNVK